MNIAKSPGAHIPAPAQIYPDSQPAEVPPRPARTGVDTRVAGASTQIDPADTAFDQQDSNRSICESDSGTSIRSNSGKPRVYKVSKRPQQEYISDPKQRLAAMGKDAFLKDMDQRMIAAFRKTKATS